MVNASSAFVQGYNLLAVFINKFMLSEHESQQMKYSVGWAHATESFLWSTDSICMNSDVYIAWSTLRHIYIILHMIADLQSDLHFVLLKKVTWFSNMCQQCVRVFTACWLITRLVKHYWEYWVWIQLFKQVQTYRPWCHSCFDRGRINPNKRSCPPRRVKSIVCLVSCVFAKTHKPGHAATKTHKPGHTAIVQTPKIGCQGFDSRWWFRFFVIF